MQKTVTSGEPVFQLLFEGSPHPYLVLSGDPKFTIVAVNNRYLSATGTHRSSILGRRTIGCVFNGIAGKSLNLPLPFIPHDL